MKITLSKPLKYRDAELTTLDLELESLTGQDLIDIEETQRLTGQAVNLFSQGYFIAIAAKALHLPAEVLKTLPAKDFLKLTNAVLFFLNDTVSEAQPQETSEVQH